VKLLASDGAAGDYFGFAVAISGDYAIAGAYYDDDKGSGSGSAYIFYRNQGGPNNWGQQAKLLASDGAPVDHFGHTVSISGNYAIVGSIFDDDNGNNSGSAYIFYRNEGGPNNWGEQAKLTASDGASVDRFGESVSISGDNAIVGAPYKDSYTGSAYMFKRNGKNWIQVEKLIASDAEAADFFSCSVFMNAHYAIVGANGNNDYGYNSGSAYVFENVCNTEPVADAGDDQEVSTGPNGTVEVVLDCSDSNDADGDELTYSWLLDGEEIATGVNPTIELPCGTYTIELIVNDGMTDSEPDDVEISVLDGTPPVITCPPDLTLECPGVITPDVTGEATATDICSDNVTITFGDTCELGCGGTKTCVRTWTATDESGNSSTCVQTITVVDTTPPVITCPPDMTLECPANTNPGTTGQATATDTCGSVTITYNNVSVPGSGDTETITRTWTATDECSNISACIQIITVVDTTMR
jgi:hypothetical protein